MRIIDATWYMPSDPPRRPKEEFLKGPRIAGVAGFFDVDDVADKTHPLGLKHMMPSPEVFADACGRWTTSSLHACRQSVYVRPAHVGGHG